MQQRRWYNPTRYIVRFFRYAINKSTNPAIFLLSCIAYACFDVYGAAKVPSIFYWLAMEVRRIKEKQRANKKSQ